MNIINNHIKFNINLYKYFLIIKFFLFELMIKFYLEKKLNLLVKYINQYKTAIQPKNELFMYNLSKYNIYNDKIYI